MNTVELPRYEFGKLAGKLASNTLLGFYPLFYIAKGGSILCPHCARIDDSRGETPEACEANWEDPSMYCDECSHRIPSAYAEDDAKDDATWENGH